MTSGNITQTPLRLITCFMLVATLLVACQAEPAPVATPTAAPVLRLNPTLKFTPDGLPTFTLPALAFSHPRPTRTPIPPIRKIRPTVVKTASAVRAVPYPAEFQISNISGHKQVFELGCETSAAVDWAGYFGVTVNEYTFQADIPLSDNPDQGFVGDVHGTWGQIPPNDYGVHAAPVAELLIQYGLPAHAYKQYTLEKIKLHISRGKPVLAWVVGNVGPGVPTHYTDPDGRQSTVAAFEHVVIVTGYDENTDHIRYLNNGRFYDATQEMFLASWGVLENMVIVLDEPGQSQ